MSGLNSFIEKTGLRLPTPIINLVTVNDDSLEIEVSFKFNFTNSVLDDTSINELIEEMTSGPSPIYAYVMYVMDTAAIDDLVSGKNKDPLSELYPAVIAERTDQDAYTKNYALINLSDFTKVEQVYSEETKNLIVTLSTTSKIQNSYDLVGLSDEMTLDDIMRQTDRTEVTVFAFTSTINFDSTDNEFGYNFIVEAAVQFIVATDYKKRKYDLPDAILEHMSSEISYENVYKDSELNVGTRSIFIDNENEPYHLNPVKGLDNKPYKQTGIDAPEIREVFKTLTGNSTSESSALQEILNSIDLITATEDDKFLLQSYEKIRLSFPEKSSVTEMGRLYELFKNRILGIDRQLKSTPALQEKLYKTPKIIDNRTVEDNVTSLPSQDAEQTFLFSSANPGESEEASWTNSIAVYEESSDNTPVFKSFSRTGLCLFDYKLAQSQNSAILASYSFKSLESLFGPGIINRFFKMTNISLYRYVSGYKTEDFDTRVKDSNSTQNYEIDNNSFPSITMDIKSRSIEEIDYLQIRGIYNSDSENKFIALQLQDLIGVDVGDMTEHDIPTDDYYELTLTIEDTTLELLELIREIFHKYYNEDFTTFYEHAIEECNYNKETGYFNEFFITGIKNLYGTDTAKPPWIKMPLLLELYTRLINNTESDDDTAIKERAGITAASINPFNGTFNNLEIFKERCEEFISISFPEVEESNTLILHTFKTTINPPKPIALLVGEGWDIPEEVVEDEVLVLDAADVDVLEWIEEAGAAWRNFGMNWGWTDHGNFHTAINSKFGTTLRSSPPDHSYIQNLQDLKDSYLYNSISDFIESVDHTSGVHEKTFNWNVGLSYPYDPDTPIRSTSDEEGDYKIKIIVKEDYNTVFAYKTTYRVKTS